MKKKKHGKSRDSYRLKSRKTNTTESHFEVLPYLAVSQGESFSSKCEFPRVPTFAVSTFTDVARARELSPSTNKRRKITRMENSLSSVSPSRTRHPVQLSETRQGRPSDARISPHGKSRGARLANPIAINRRTFNETERSIRAFLFSLFPLSCREARKPRVEIYRRAQSRRRFNSVTVKVN